MIEPRSIKALVLTYDAYHPFVGHMIATYEARWPDHPFVFRVPFQQSAQELVERYGDLVEPVRTRSDIRGAVLDLTDGLDPDEWIYWCIDDKYLIDADLPRCKLAANWIVAQDDPDIACVSICRTHCLLRPTQVNLGIGQIGGPDGMVFLKRRSFGEIWLHQFARVKVIRQMFRAFPDRPFRAKEMDTFISTWGRRRPQEIPARWGLYVSRDNHCVFGESTTRGKITRNCRGSFETFGLPLPDFEFSDEHKILGARLGPPGQLVHRVYLDFVSLRSNAVARLFGQCTELGSPPTPGGVSTDAN